MKYASKQKEQLAKESDRAGAQMGKGRGLGDPGGDSNGSSNYGKTQNTTMALMHDIIAGSDRAERWKVGWISVQTKPGGPRAWDNISETCWFD